MGLMGLIKNFLIKKEDVVATKNEMPIEDEAKMSIEDEAKEILDARRKRICIEEMKPKKFPSYTLPETDAAECSKAIETLEILKHNIHHLTGRMCALDEMHKAEYTITEAIKNLEIAYKKQGNAVVEHARTAAEYRRSQ